jgi:hypothetical protein
MVSFETEQDNPVSGLDPLFGFFRIQLWVNMLSSALSASSAVDLF